MAMEPIPYTKEEKDTAEEIHNNRINHIVPKDKTKFTSGIFSAYVHISRNGEYSVCSEFVNMKTKTWFRHNKCGYEYQTLPERFYYHGASCPECFKKERSEALRRINKERTEHRNNGITPLDEDIRMATNKDILKAEVEKYIVEIPYNKRETTRTLITALNNPLFISGSYNNTIHSLRLYMMNYHSRKIELITKTGEIDTGIFQFNKSSRTISRYSKPNNQYEFYNPKMILTLVDNSLGFCKAIFNDRSDTMFFVNSPVPENILDIPTIDKLTFDYRLVYNIMEFALNNKIVKKIDVNNIVANYIENGYSAILRILPYHE